MVLVTQTKLEMVTVMEITITVLVTMVMATVKTKIMVMEIITTTINRHVVMDAATTMDGIITTIITTNQLSQHHLVSTTKQSCIRGSTNSINTSKHQHAHGIHTVKLKLPFRGVLICLKKSSCTDTICTWCIFYIGSIRNFGISFKVFDSTSIEQPTEICF